MRNVRNTKMTTAAEDERCQQPFPIYASKPKVMRKTIAQQLVRGFRTIHAHIAKKEGRTETHMYVHY